MSVAAGVVDNVLKTTSCEPRGYQHRVCSKVVDLFNGTYVEKGATLAPAKSVMIESPTGSGKTVMGNLSIKALQSLVPDLAVGWVAMRRNLLSQANAENRSLGINAEGIHYVSMFDKNPHGLIAARASGQKVLLVVDECLAGESLVKTMVDGVESLVPISDIVNNGIGSHVLSYDIVADAFEWQPIVSRTCTGVKDVFKVTVETDDGRVVTIVCTDTHRFMTPVDGHLDYLRLSEMAVGSEVYVKVD